MVLIVIKASLSLCSDLDFCPSRQAKCFPDISKRAAQLLLEPAGLVFASVAALT